MKRTAFTVIEKSFDIKICRKCFDESPIKEHYTLNGDGEIFIILKAKDSKCWDGFLNKLQQKYVLKKVDTSYYEKELLFNLLREKQTNNYLFIERRKVSKEGNIEQLILDNDKERVYFYMSLL